MSIIINQNFTGIFDVRTVIKSRHSVVSTAMSGVWSHPDTINFAFQQINSTKSPGQNRM